MTENRSPHGFSLEAIGDFVGRGIWTFEQVGDETIVTYDWKISAEKGVLKTFSFLMKPIFGANHRWAMAQGERVAPPGDRPAQGQDARRADAHPTSARPDLPAQPPSPERLGPEVAARRRQLVAAGQEKARGRRARPPGPTSSSVVPMIAVSTKRGHWVREGHLATLLVGAEAFSYEWGRYPRR